jgi:hypothetical protein
MTKAFPILFLLLISKLLFAKQLFMPALEQNFLPKVRFAEKVRRILAY